MVSTILTVPVDVEEPSLTIFRGENEQATPAAASGVNVIFVVVEVKTVVVGEVAVAVNVMVQSVIVSVEV